MRGFINWKNIFKITPKVLSIPEKKKLKKIKKSKSKLPFKIKN
jgi:hypothetical protein